MDKDKQKRLFLSLSVLMIPIKKLYLNYFLGE